MRTMAPRGRLKARIVARLSATPLPHPCLTEILRHREVDRPVRTLALALTRVELECRHATWRALEYAYVCLGCPGYRAVSIGPSQIRWSHLLSAHDSICQCSIRARP